MRPACTVVRLGGFWPKNSWYTSLCSVKRVGSVRYALTLIRSHFATDASQNRLNVFQCLAYLLFEIVRHHTRTRNLWALACDENETIGDYRLRTRTGRLGSFGDNDGFLHNRKSSIGCFQ